mmetsp:Transcript_23507/g.39387  ORF Transcript_23507/g.39387 Transcript_23507/m.39387 type:complete len:300 (+) Transcript_23507:134-1033(+)
MAVRACLFLVGCVGCISLTSALPNEIPTVPGPSGVSEAPKTPHVLQYPRCQYAHVDAIDDKDFIIKQLTASPTFTKPFDSATYFCGLFPPTLFREIIENFPPDKAFENYASKIKKCDLGGCRYSLSAFNILRQKKIPNWPGFQPAKKLYQKLVDIVFSSEFEKALWEKLKITKKSTRREFRILSDKHGFSNGRIHTDIQARKIATMMFYLPVTNASAFDYGTCLHTTDQWKNRRILKKGGVKREDTGLDGEGDCFYKFRFLPNTGYSFKVSHSSWHSAPNTVINHFDEHDRNTILLNWY